jgi:hypothetical protein
VIDFEIIFLLGGIGLRLTIKMNDVDKLIIFSGKFGLFNYFGLF